MTSNNTSSSGLPQENQQTNRAEQQDNKQEDRNANNVSGETSNNLQRPSGSGVIAIPNESVLHPGSKEPAARRHKPHPSSSGTETPELREKQSRDSSEDTERTAASGEDTEENIQEKKQRRRFSGSISCKICFDSSKDEENITPCLCKGSIGKVHLSCLERWLGVTNAHSCELCGYRFNTVRRPMYGVAYSVYFWIFKEQDNIYRRGVGLDAAIFLILTPIICTGMYCSVAIASFYQLGDQKSAAGNWTSIALTLMAFIMALGYYLWASLVLRSHGKAWYRWWQARNVVHVLNAHETPQPPPLPPYRTSLMVATAFV